MSKQITLQDVAVVLYAYWPDDCIRVRSALEAIVHRDKQHDDEDDYDASFATEKEELRV